LLKALTNAEPLIAAYPFTTKKPEIGMMKFEGAQLQLVEVPALVEGAAEKQSELMGIIHSSDGIMLLYRTEEEKRKLVGELHKFGIEKPIMMLEYGSVPKPKDIFNYFDLIRVYTKEPGEESEKEKPLVLKRGATVLDAAKEIHKDFVRKLLYARVWGSTRFGGQRVEKDYVLKDGDAVEFHA
jgi:ribosome-interacting GTPase 1